MSSKTIMSAVRIIAYLLTSLALLPLQALACDCLWQGNFAELDKRGATIVRGEVLSHRGNSMDLQVDEVLQGKLYRDTIRIWGDTGSLCRADLGRFDKASQWVLVLNTIDTVPEGGFNPSTPNFSYGREGDFSLNRCGVYWLEYRNGYVRGNVDDDKRWLYLDSKKSPVDIALIRAFIDGRADESLLARAARTQPEKDALLTDTRVFLRQQEREEKLREALERELAD